jgi:cytochrome c
MKKLLGIAVVLSMVILFAGSAYAVSDPELQAMAGKALDYYKANGKEKAMAEFNNQSGPFVKGDLYVVVIDHSGLVLAHGGTPALTGKSLYDQKDPTTGKYFVREMVDASKSTAGSGWVDYNWVNPTTKKIQPKRSWIKKIDGANAFVICGVFK